MIFMYVIFALSVLSMLGSMYIGSFGDPRVNISTGNRFDTDMAIVPCNLCRYIRMTMYPIVIASARSIFSHTEKPYKTITTLAMIGLMLCIYKYALEMGVWFGGEPLVCVGSAADCTTAKPLYGGFISLALLGMCTNAFILYCMYRIFRKSNS